MTLKLIEESASGISIQKHQLLEMSKAVILDENNRQVNEAREGQSTKEQKDRPVTSDVRGKPREHLWKPGQESVI